jgi:2'-5' RNA ligase
LSYTAKTQKKKPMVLRLDGIYFNSEQDFRSQNAPIKFSYDNADAVVFQSEFNKKLTEAWFGVHKNSFVVHNAFLETRSLDKTFKELHRGLEIWSCASSWRPHKTTN